MAQVFLPCESPAWSEDKRLFLLLSQLCSVQELRGLIDDHSSAAEPADQTSFEATAQRLRAISGLAIFLAELANEEERQVFFSRTLPFICRSAAALEALVPEDGIPYLRQQEGASVYLGRKLVLSLVANGFLCTFPREHPTGADIRPFNFDRFFDIFVAGEESQRSSQAGKLRCILNYFQRMSQRDPDSVEGVICYARQVIARDQMPSVNNWKECEYPLCPVTIDNTRGIEDAGGRTLQVDFANCCIGGDTLEDGAVQEEIRFCLCPELLPAMFLMDQMEDNEAVLVTGYERFSNYKGYGKSFQFTGDHQDLSERDIYSNVRSALVAIDALSFAHHRRQPGDQYRENHVLRELNKAYAGYLCRDERGDLAMEQVALTTAATSDTATTEEELFGGNASVVDTVSQATEEEEQESEGGGIEKYSNSLSAAIVKDAMNSLADGEGEEGRVQRFSNELSSSIVRDAVSSFAEVQKNDAVQKMATSLVKNVVEEAMNDQVHLAHQREDVARRVANRVVERAIAEVRHGWEEVSLQLPVPATASRSTPDGETLSCNSMSSFTGQPLLPIEFTDSLVEDVVQSGIRKAASNPFPPPVTTTTTTGGPTPPVSISVESPVHRPTVAVATGAPSSSSSATDLAGKGAQDTLSGVTVAAASSPKKTVLMLSSAAGLGLGGGKLRKSPVTGRRGNSPGSDKPHPFRASRGSSLDAGDALDPRALYPPSSRMSVAWSTTSTRDEGSAPPSPTELDRVALGMVTTIDEFATVLVEFVVREAITKATESRDVYFVDEMVEDTERHDSKIHTFLHSLQEAGSQYSLDAAGQEILFPFSPRWHSLQKSVLRPVATGNWGSGVFKGDPQLKAVLQWMVVSATGRPEMKYHPFNDARVQQLPEVVEKSLMTGWSVGELCKMVLDYCSRRLQGETSKELFTELLHA